MISAEEMPLNNIVILPESADFFRFASFFLIGFIYFCLTTLIDTGLHILHSLPIFAEFHDEIPPLYSFSYSGIPDN